MTSLVIETQRLRLRPLDGSDVDLAVEMFTDRDVSRYVGGIMERDDIIAEFPTWTRRCGNGAIGIWCVADKSTGEKLGTSVLLPLPINAEDTEWDLFNGGVVYPDRDIEVGYILRKPAWGRGLATEICRALLGFAFEHTPLEEVIAVTDPDNFASQHVLTKCGMRATGPRRAYAKDGTPGFSITRKEWLAS